VDFDATLCNTVSGGAPQIGKHALHKELSSIVESGAFQIEIVTKQNPQHHSQIVKFLDVFGWTEGRQYSLHCIGGTGVSKASIIQAHIDRQRLHSDDKNCAIFIDDSIKEILQARSELPLSVTMLVFAAAKSSYSRSHPGLLAASSSFASIPTAVSENTTMNPSESFHLSAAKVEHMLGVKVDLCQPACCSLDTSSAALSSSLQSSTADTASAVLKDGPGWSVASGTSPNLCASATRSSSESCTGNFSSILRLVTCTLIFFCVTVFKGFEASTTLEQLRQLQERWVIERNWAQYHTPRNLILALVGEVGELAELFQWRGEVACSLPGWTDKRELHFFSHPFQVFHL
jgi:hypothetical protein